MKTFIVLSDTHGHLSAVEKLRPLFGENDYIVHLGDGSADMRKVYGEFPEKTYLLRGNNDFSRYGEDELIIGAEGLSLYCCHGHCWGVKSGLDRLARRAKEKGCEVALYGHTHRASVDTVDGVLCINPGAAGALFGGSYCYLVLHRGKATPTIVELH